jgi:4-hydroxy-3-polyprenylbenzoate decarboxylase
MRLVVAVTGATGAIYAVKLLEALKINEVDVHLIVSHWAEKTLHLEMGLTAGDTLV